MRIQSRGVGAALVGIVGLWAAGCSQNVLDFRNAEVSNGKIYADGANKPFTGKVTHIPDGQILRNQAVMPSFFQPLRVLYLQKDGHMLDKVLLTGSLCDVQVREGVLHGETICKFPQSDAKRYEMTFKEGRLDGQITFYGPPPRNWVVVKGAVSEGVLDGTLEVISPKTQKLVHRQHLKKGVNQGSETVWDEDTGQEVGKATYVDGKVDGPILRFAADGKTPVYRAVAIRGVLNGTEEIFDPKTGVLTRKVEWSHGKRHGAWKEWDPDGKLRVDNVYQDDRLVSTRNARAASPDSADCERAWLEAHRRHVGPDAPVSAAQLGEWQEMCQEGKQAPK